MYQKLCNELGLILAVFDKETLSPTLRTIEFTKIAGNTSEEIFSFFSQENKKFSKEIILNTEVDSPNRFFIQVKIGRQRRSIEFEVSRNSDGDITFYGKDITEQKKMEFSLQSYSTIMESQEKKLHKMAYTDSLTGASNRRAIFEAFEEYSKDPNNILGAVCILDIDHFKAFNDRYGHEFGDHVLKYFSKKVSDALDDDCFFARIGGEEFCVFSYSRTERQLNALIDTVLDSIKDEDIITPEQVTTNISFSAGIAEYSIDGKTLDDLLNNADKALYFAKAAGRSRVISFSTELFEKRDYTLIPNYRDADR